MSHRAILLLTFAAITVISGCGDDPDSGSNASASGGTAGSGNAGAGGGDAGASGSSAGGATGGTSGSASGGSAGTGAAGAAGIGGAAGRAGNPFVTYLGGSKFEHSRDAIFDAAGNCYVTGGSDSPNFPISPGAHDTTPNGNVDVFVAKFAPDGTRLWSTVLGSPNYDRAYAIELDPQGNVVVAGRAGAGFPASAGALQTSFGGDQTPSNIYGPQDGFVAKLSSDGALIWATYFGGPGSEFIRDIAIDSSGSVYLAVSQVTRDLAHVKPGSFGTTRKAMDAVAAKISADGKNVIWAGYLGGTGNDGPEPSIRVDGANAAYILIGTQQDGLPVSANAYQKTRKGVSDPFIAKIAPDGASLAYGTYVGGSAADGLETHNLWVDANGSAVIAATTRSTDIPTTSGAFQPAYGGTGGPGTGQNTNYGGDGWIGKLSPDGGSLVAASYLGGNAGEGIEGVAVDAAGRIWVSGGTFSASFPTTNGAFQTQPGGGLDGFVAVFSGDLETLHAATRIGGSKDDVVRALAIDGLGNCAVAGQTVSTDFPVTPGAFQLKFGGSTHDALLAKLKLL